MKASGTRGVLILILFILVGGIRGGMAGDLFTGSGVSLGNLMPLLTRQFEIFSIQNVDLNLYIMQIRFGLHFAPNLLSLIGIICACFIFRRI